MSLEAMKRNGHDLHLGDFEVAGRYGIPVLRPVQLDRKLEWERFNHVLKLRRKPDCGVHFFTDDYLFERVWHDPERYAAFLGQFPAVMSPDFSLFSDYPMAVQIYNHWRKHQIAAYWQSKGITVIPSICWSGYYSYDWCFDGEPVGGTVAVSSTGTQKNPQSRVFFLEGYREMMARLRPAKVIFFGSVPDGCDGNIEHLPPTTISSTVLTEVTADGRQRRSEPRRERGRRSGQTAPDGSQGIP